MGNHAKVVPIGKHPFFFDDFFRTAEPIPAITFPDRKVARFRQPLVIAHALEHTIEFRLFRQPFRVEFRHDREGSIVETEVALRIELRRAGGHAVGKLALGFDVPGELGSGILEILDIDREAGDCAGGQGDVDDPQHPPLAADDRGLHR